MLLDYKFILGEIGVFGCAMLSSKEMCINLYEMTSERPALHSKNCRMITKIKDIVTSCHYTLRTGKKKKKKRATVND